MGAFDNLLNFLHPHIGLIAAFCAMTVGIVIAALASEFYSRKHVPLATGRDLDGCVFMKLQPIQLFPTNESRDLQIITYINGMEFHYPSSDKTKWLSAAQKMAEVVIELPNAELYRIHLAVQFRAGEILEGSPLTVRRAMLLPQEDDSTPLPQRRDKIMVAEEYKLYSLAEGLRNISIKAIIPYEISIQ